MNAAQGATTHQGEGIVLQAWEKNADVGKCCRFRIAVRKQ
jgi:hypothetical protein